jgi:hypothetical protein
MTDQNARMKLMAGERVIMTSNDEMLTLTSHRVRLDTTVRGASKFVSITLDSVASCGLVTRTRPVLLILGAVAGIVGVAQSAAEARFGLLVVAAVLVIVYFVTRAAVVTIASTGGETITLPAKGMGREAIVEFLEEVEHAKLGSGARSRFVSSGAAR